MLTVLASIITTIKGQIPPPQFPGGAGGGAATLPNPAQPQPPIAPAGYQGIGCPV